jgi:hypothetical protein
VFSLRPPGGVRGTPAPANRERSSRNLPQFHSGRRFWKKGSERPIIPCPGPLAAPRQRIFGPGITFRRNAPERTFCAPAKGRGAIVVICFPRLWAPGDLNPGPHQCE